MLKNKMLLGLLMVTASSAYAFHIDDHERIMRQAVTEFTACHPEYARSLNADWLVEGDRDEDLDFVTKQLFFSHFYHPGKDLPLMWRKDSAARLTNLAPSLMQCRQDHDHLTYAESTSLGHAIHHLQDMTVPSHVVPVMHSFWDAFETYRVAGEIASGWDCATLDRSGAALETVLNETAEATLTSVRALQFTLYAADGSALVKTGLSFWLEGPGNSFGRYGELGNYFGHGHFKLDGVNYGADVKIFESYKIDQMRLAVRSSLRALSFHLLQTGPPASL